MTRNLLRRRTRAALIEMMRSDTDIAAGLASGRDIVIILKPAAAQSSYTELSKALAMALERAHV